MGKITHGRYVCGQIECLVDGFLVEMSEKVIPISFERMKVHADVIELSIATDRHRGDFEVAYDLPEGVDLRHMADCLISLAHHIYRLDTH